MKTEIDFELNWFSIMTDRSRLMQIMNNFVSNSLKFTHQGYINVSVKLKDERSIEFVVRDSGIGIPREQVDSLFKLFQK